MNSPLTGKRVGVYARFSSDNQKDTSIDDQVRLCTEFVGKLGGEVRADLVMADHAISGSVRERPQFERLQRLVANGEIDVIVAESADRLSRDLGDSDRLWKLISFYNVRLICVSDGIDSANEAARMNFRFKAVFADEFLGDLGKKTSRGLHGAARRGGPTGGLPYGYATRWPSGVPTEKEHPEIVIHDDQARVLRRIFEMYRDGHGYLPIATTLNSERVASPRANSRKRPNGFWRKSTIREMLRNAAYIGQWTFGKRKWTKNPETRKRCYGKGDPAKLHQDERPHLRIIDADLWDAVQSRRDLVGENYRGKGHGAPGHRTKHPFSGLLFCAVCGHRMVDGGGSTTRAYRCSAASTGGMCSNKARLREDALAEAAVTALKRLLLQTDLHEQLHEKIQARLARFKLRSNDDRVRLERDLTRSQAEVQRLVSFIRVTDPTVTPGAFQAVTASLEEATREAKAIQAKLDTLGASSVEPKLPTVEEIAAYVLDIESRLRDEPTTAREALRNVLLDGKITMTPEADGSWSAVSALIVGRLAPGTRKPRNLAGSGALRTSTEKVEIGRCAGRI